MYIPYTCMWKDKMLRYKYVVICKNGETKNELLEHQWRIFMKGSLDSFCNCIVNYNINF